MPRSTRQGSSYPRNAPLRVPIDTPRKISSYVSQGLSWSITWSGGPIGRIVPDTPMSLKTAKRVPTEEAATRPEIGAAIEALTDTDFQRLLSFARRRIWLIGPKAEGKISPTNTGRSRFQPRCASSPMRTFRSRS